jgi:hypothetical protein
MSSRPARLRDAVEVTLAGSVRKEITGLTLCSYRAVSDEIKTIVEVHWLL